MILSCCRDGTQLIVTLGAFTMFLGSTCDGVFEGFAAGVVASAHSTLVVLL